MGGAQLPLAGWSKAEQEECTGQMLGAWQREERMAGARQRGKCMARVRQGEE